MKAPAIIPAAAEASPPSAAAPAAPPIERLEEAWPPFAAAKQRFEDAKAAESAVDAEIQQLLAALAPPEGKSNTAPISPMMARLLGEDVLPDNSQPRERSRKRYDEARSERAECGKAIQMLRVRVEEERMRASKIVCHDQRDHYRSLVVDVCQRLIDVHRAQLVLQMFVDDLDRRGVAWTAYLQPMQPTFLGDPFDTRYGRLADYLADAVDRGFIGVDQLPELLRKNARIELAAIAAAAAANAPTKAAAKSTPAQDDDWAA